MLIAGEWLTADDGVTRPIVRARVGGVAGQVHRERFLIDTGADRTVLGAAILAQLGLPAEAPPPGTALRGIGGDTGMVLVATTLGFARDDGGTALVRGRFAAFTDPHAIDVSILGRDVLDHFDVIVSRRRDEVLLLASSHRYSVTPA
jgi:hypothetical protein